MSRSRAWMLRSPGLAAGLAAIVASSTLLAADPHVVLAIQSVDEILGDSSYVMGGGAKNGPSPLEGLIHQFTGGKGLEGVDRTKPLGVSVTFTPAGMPEGVAWIPVKDPRAFCQAWQARFPEGQPGDNRLFVTQALGVQLAGKVSGGYCFLSMSPPALEAPTVPRTEGGRDVTLQVNFSQIPDELKEMMIQQIKARLEAQRMNLPGSASASYTRGYVAGQAYMHENIEKTIRDAQRFGLGLTVDQGSGVVSLDWELVAKPGTPLANEMTSFGSSSTSFGGLVSNDAAASLILTGVIPPQIRESLGQELARAADEVRATVDNEVSLRAPAHREAAHESLESFFKAWSGLECLDVAGVLDTAPGGRLRLVLATKVANGSELTKALERIGKSPEGPLGKDSVKLDVASHAGARIHSVKLPADMERDLGKGPAHVALRGDSVFVALGSESLTTVKAALDRTASPGPRRPPVSLHIRPSKLIDLLAPAGSPAAAKARNAFQGKGDHASFEVVPVPYGARGKVTLGEGFIKLIAAETASPPPARTPAGSPKPKVKR